jgi:transposase
MAKRKFHLTQAQENELQSAERHSKDGMTKTRYQAVRLYGKRYAVAEIMAITGCSRPSLMEWCRTYRQEGVAGLIDKRKGGNHALLSAVEIEEVQRQLHNYTPVQLFGPAASSSDGQFWTVAELARLVQQRFGVVYQSRTSYYTLFEKCGFSRQRPGAPYRSRSQLQVSEFEDRLEKNSSTPPKPRQTP